MKRVTMAVGYIPLLDAAPLIVAHEMGFAEQEGIHLDLKPAPSWSSLRDMLSFGKVDAAHMLSPVPVSTALGLGGAFSKLSVVSVLSINGNVFGVNRALEAALHQAGHDFGFDDPTAAGRMLKQVKPDGLRIGVPFPFSMHAEQVLYWFGAMGWQLDVDFNIRTVPPVLMGEAIAAGEIDAFCVGEPWGSLAVERGSAALLLPTSAIWKFAPEKVLAVREDWAETETSLLSRLIRAVWRAGRWLSQDKGALLTAELLGRKKYLNLPPELLERGLRGEHVVTADGARRSSARFLEFYAGNASFPWRSQAQWIADRLAVRMGIDPLEAQQRARSVFRPDLHRRALDGTGIDLPGASVKLEGALQVDTAVASANGTVILCRDAFFDGHIFEPIG